MADDQDIALQQNPEAHFPKVIEKRPLKNVSRRWREAKGAFCKGLEKL